MSAFGLAAVPFIFEVVAPTLKKDAKKLKIVTTYEDSLYGTITADAFKKLGSEKGLNFVGEFVNNSASSPTMFQSDVSEITVWMIAKI